MGKLDSDDTFTIGGLIADSLRNSKAGQTVEEYLHQRGINDPRSPEYQEMVEAMPSMQGGRTPSRTKMSRADRKAADAAMKKIPRKKR